MTTEEIAAVLARARWVRSMGGTSEGFRVARTAEGVTVSWVTPAWNVRTRDRMLGNYEQTLKDRGYQVTRHKDYLVVTGKK